MVNQKTSKLKKFFILFLVTLIGITIRISFEHHLWGSRNLPPEADDSYIYLKNATQYEQFGIRGDVPALVTLQQQYSHLELYRLPVRDRILRTIYFKNYSFGYTFLLIFLKKLGLSAEKAMQTIFYFGQVFLIVWAVIFSLRFSDNIYVPILSVALVTFLMGGGRGWHLVWPDNLCALLFLYLILLSTWNRKELIIVMPVLATLLLFFHWQAIILIPGLVISDLIMTRRNLENRNYYLSRGLFLFALPFLTILFIYMAHRIYGSMSFFYFPFMSESNGFGTTVGFKALGQNLNIIKDLMIGKNTFRGFIYVFLVLPVIFLCYKYYFKLFSYWFGMTVLFFLTLFHYLTDYKWLVGARFLTPYSTICCIVFGVLFVHIIRDFKRIKNKVFAVLVSAILLAMTTIIPIKGYKLLNNEIENRVKKRNFVFAKKRFLQWKNSLNPDEPILYEDDLLSSLAFTYGMLEYPAYFANLLPFEDETFFAKARPPAYLVRFDKGEKIVHLKWNNEIRYKFLYNFGFFNAYKIRID